jgi:EAL domain-containing protein (putative c-di-GMP-specific phosphodiesterase class I)
VQYLHVAQSGTVPMPKAIMTKGRWSSARIDDSGGGLQLVKSAVQQVLYDNLDPTSLLERVTRASIDLLEAADGATVHMIYGGRIRTMAASGRVVGRVGDEFALTGTLAGEAAARGVPMRCDDVHADERIPDKVRRGETRSVIAAPLLAGDHVIGLLGVMSPRLAAFDDFDLEAIGRVCSFVGATVAASLATTAAAREALESICDPSALEDCCRGGREVGDFLAEVTCPGAVSALRARGRISQAIAEGQPRCAVQPIIRLSDGQLVGAEALARFGGIPRRGPDLWFAEAHGVGLGIELETVAVRQALQTLDALPDLKLISINVTQDMLVSGALPALLDGYPGSRVLLELTEHVAICDYGPVRRTVDDLRRRGVGLAIDDVGAGYSCFRHIVELEPECIKLDRTFMEGVETKRAWEAMAKALIEMADATGARVIAEGIETEAHLALARELGAGYGQGYLIARPSEPQAMPMTFEDLPPALGAAARTAA